MKYQNPDFLKNVISPTDGEMILRNYFSKIDKKGIVVGIDEVGRGPLAGPVVACAAVLKSSDVCQELMDSKKMSRSKREAIYEKVKSSCECYAIASASVEEIDKYNILEADFLAMRRALEALGIQNILESKPELAIEVKGRISSATQVLLAVDGNLEIRGLEFNPQITQMPIIKGDGIVASISAASILAKVFRDRFMDKLAEQFPQYGFEKNAGYGTKSHLEAIRKYGLSPVHRKSFHPKNL